MYKFDYPYQFIKFLILLLTVTILKVCKKGAALTPEQASILKLLGIQMAKFKLVIKCHWTKGKGFHKDLDGLSDNESDDENEKDKENDAMEDEDMEDDET